MRQYGHAVSDASNPRAHAICDRCGARYNLVDLKWQYDWAGPKLQNLRFLVCESCLDKPQPNGQRTFILPADPVPVQNPRPEFYVYDDNPLSALGAAPRIELQPYSNQIGTMIYGGGVPSAFDGNGNKSQQFCAAAFTPQSSYENYVGINWTGNQNNTFPSNLQAPTQTHTLSSCTLYGPNDSIFGSNSILVQGSSVGGDFGNWTTLFVLTPANTVAETLSGTPSAITSYQFHRVAFKGGATQISVAQVLFSVDEVFTPSSAPTPPPPPSGYAPTYPYLGF